jgi:hypothetical protein
VYFKSFIKDCCQKERCRHRFIAPQHNKEINCFHPLDMEEGVGCVVNGPSSMHTTKLVTNNNVPLKKITKVELEIEISYKWYGRLPIGISFECLLGGIPYKTDPNFLDVIVSV